jgi:hypothetical protein
VLDIVERRFVTLTLVYSTLPLPTVHRVLYGSNKGKKKEDAADKTYRYLNDTPDSLAPANEI